MPTRDGFYFLGYLFLLLVASSSVLVNLWILRSAITAKAKRNHLSEKDGNDGAHIDVVPKHRKK